jgi:hypothetical protein
VTHPNNIPEHFITHSAQEGTVTTNDITPDFRTPAADPAKPKNGAATAALVLGIIGLLLVVVPGLNAGLGIAAIVTGAVGLSKAKRVRVGQAKAAVGLSLGIVTMLGAFFALVSAADSDEPQVTITQEAGPGISEPETAKEPAAEPEEPKAEPKPAPEVEPEEPSLTLEQEQAILAAASYLDFKAFSRQGLIDQLSSEYGSGFTVEAATFAVDALDVDWNAEAVRSAQEYLDFTSFSRQGLIEQLSSPYGAQFTVEQATYAADQVGF